jgi:polar amino acid transport system substrate-binding protein
MQNNMVINSSLSRVFAPTGILRASINLGNPILANSNPVTGEPFGVSVDIANELAKRLKLPIQLVLTDAAGKSVNTVAEERADFGFFAIDPIRGRDIAFTVP